MRSARRIEPERMRGYKVRDHRVEWRSLLPERLERGRGGQRMHADIQVGRVLVYELLHVRFISGHKEAVTTRAWARPLVA